MFASLENYLKKISLLFKDLVLKWWSKRGNRSISIDSCIWFLIFVALFQFFGSLVVLAVVGNLFYLALLDESGSIIMNAGVNFFLLVGILLMFAFGFLYVRKMRQHTFKNVPLTRATFLRWDFWSLYFKTATFIVYETVVLVFLGVTFLKSFLAIKLDIAFPVSIFLAIIWTIAFNMIFLYLAFSIGMKGDQKVAYCLDYLARLDEIHVLYEKFGSKVSRAFDKDTSYIAKTCADKLNRIILLDHYIGDSVNLGPYISTTYLGLFWGNNKEKEKTADFLKNMRDLLLHQQNSCCRELVEGFIDFSKKIPRIRDIRTKLSLNITSAKRVSTLEKLRENSVIITIISVFVAFISLVRALL